MNYIKQLNYFYNKIQYDHKIAPCQIALYLALFQCWNRQRFENPIFVIRDEVMRLSKITSKSTYHRSMNILHDNGYIIYEPSYNPYMGSKIYFQDLSKLNNSAKNTILKNSNGMKKAVAKPSKQTRTKKEQDIDNAMQTPTEKPIEPIYKHINNKHINNRESVCKQAQIPSLIFDKKEQNNLSNIQTGKMEEMNQKEKSSAKKEKGTIPTYDEVIEFFQEKYENKQEGEKFFYYFESNGWLVGGKTQMKNWTAAANNWMINMNKYNNPNLNTFGVQKPLDTSPNKRYDEPL